MDLFVETLQHVRTRCSMLCSCALRARCRGRVLERARIHTRVHNDSTLPLSFSLYISISLSIYLFLSLSPSLSVSVSPSPSLALSLFYSLTYSLTLTLTHSCAQVLRGMDGPALESLFMKIDASLSLSLSPSLPLPLSLSHTHTLLHTHIHTRTHTYISEREPLHQDRRQSSPPPPCNQDRRPGELNVRPFILLLHPLFLYSSSFPPFRTPSSFAYPAPPPTPFFLFCVHLCVCAYVRS